jgi:hypothetical protein
MRPIATARAEHGHRRALVFGDSFSLALTSLARNAKSRAADAQRLFGPGQNASLIATPSMNVPFPRSAVGDAAWRWSSHFERTGDAPRETSRSLRRSAHAGLCPTSDGDRTRLRWIRRTKVFPCRDHRRHRDERRLLALAATQAKAARDRRELLRNHLRHRAHRSARSNGLVPVRSCAVWNVPAFRLRLSRTSRGRDLPASARGGRA